MCVSLASVSIYCAFMIICTFIGLVGSLCGWNRMINIDIRHTRTQFLFFFFFLCKQPPNGVNITLNIVLLPMAFGTTAACAIYEQYVVVYERTNSFIVIFEKNGKLVNICSDKNRKYELELEHWLMLCALRGYSLHELKCKHMNRWKTVKNECSWRMTVVFHYLLRKFVKLSSDHVFGLLTGTRDDHTHKPNSKTTNR